MEELEEKGAGVILTEEEEASMFWGGGGEALRSKRQREWEEEAWERYEVREEEEIGAMGTVKVGAREAVSDIVLEEDVMGETMLEQCGNVGDMDGGGDVGEEEGRHVTVAPERKPLRGKRRTKKSIRKEGERRMANMMSNWLGTRPM